MNNIEEDKEKIEEGIKELKSSYELHQCDWAKIILKKISKATENMLKKIKELEEENRTQRSQLMSAFDRGFIPKQVIIDAISRNLEKDSSGRLIFDFNSCQKLSIEIVKLMREGI